MVRTERSPAWHRDVKWVSAILLVLSVAVATLAFSLTELTVQRRALPVLQRMLQLTLAPQGSAQPALAVRTGSAYRPGQKLMLLPGVQVYADPTEVASFTVDQAVNRIAGVLAQRTVDGGSKAALALVTDAGIEAQLRQAFQGPVPELVTSGLGSLMLPSGLENGSRLADWPKQAAKNPGKPVQPIVGIFVYTQPSKLATMSNRQIGEMVVSQLSADVLADGMAATRQKVVNTNLRARFDEALRGPVPNSLHELFAAMLLGRQDAIASRLAAAKAVLKGEERKTANLQGLLPASRLAGLSPQKADAVVLSALAERNYRQGASGILALMTRSDQRAKVQRIAPLLDAFSSAAHGRYLLWTWLSGILALVFLVVVMATTSGLLRLVYAGIAVALGAAGGAWFFDRAGSLGPGSATPQTALAQFGVLGGLGSGVRYVAGALPPDLWSVPLRNHLIVLIFGGALVLLAVVLWLLQRLRPRRRALL